MQAFIFELADKATGFARFIVTVVGGCGYRKRDRHWILVAHANVRNDNGEKGIEKHPYSIENLAHNITGNKRRNLVPSWGYGVLHDECGGTNFDGANATITDKVSISQFSRSSFGKTNGWVALTTQNNKQRVHDYHADKRKLHTKECK